MKKYLLCFFAISCVSSAGRIKQKDADISMDSVYDGLPSTGGIKGTGGFGTGGQIVSVSTGGHSTGGMLMNVGGGSSTGGIGGELSPGGTKGTGGITSTGGITGSGGTTIINMNVSITNNCSEVPNIDYAFFNETTKETFKSNAFNCSIGDMICFGALGSDKATTWGVGITNTTTCSDCCFMCSQSSMSTIKSAKLSCKECQ